MGKDIVVVRDRKRPVTVAAPTVLVIAGLVAWPAGVVPGELVHPCFEEILPRLSAGPLVAAAVLGYRLEKSRPPGIDPDSSSGR